MAGGRGAGGPYDIPVGTRFPLVTVFFSRDLTQVDEDASGWIFAQGGPTYIAYRPFAAGEWKPNDWTGLLRGGAGGFISTGFAEWGTGHRCYVSPALRNGYAVQVAAARKFASYEAFKAAVRALPLKFSTAAAPEASFTTLDGSVIHARYGAPPVVNGRPVDFAHWPLFDGPFRPRRARQRHAGDRPRRRAPAAGFPAQRPHVHRRPDPAMNRRLLVLLSLALAIRGLAAETAPAGRAFAAVAMTKAQKNSSVPLDSGLYVRGVDGAWTHFGPRILGVSSVAASPAQAGLSPRERRRRGALDGRRPFMAQVACYGLGGRRRAAPSPLIPVTRSTPTPRPRGGPLRSTDGGATWQLAQRGLDRLYCHMLVADARRSRAACCSAPSWASASPPTARPRGIRWSFPPSRRLRLVQSGADMLAGTQGRGAWLSRDGGVTWQATAPAAASANLYAVALAPQDVALLAVGGWGVGVQVSADGGRTWADRSAGLPNRNIFVVAFDPDVKGACGRPRSKKACSTLTTWASPGDGGLYGAYASDLVFVKPGR